MILILFLVSLAHIRLLREVRNGKALYVKMSSPYPYPSPYPYVHELIRLAVAAPFFTTLPALLTTTAPQVSKSQGSLTVIRREVPLHAPNLADPPILISPRFLDNLDAIALAE